MLSMLCMQTVALTQSPPVVKSFRYAGATSPLGYFDPLKISYNKNEKQLQYLREAELQHARVAMSSLLTFPLIEYFYKDDLAVNFLAHQTLTTQLPYWFSIMLFEVGRMRTYWKDPFKTDKFFNIKDNAQPGNVFSYDKDSIQKSSLNKELNNGRLAMLAVIYMMIYEVYTQHQIFHF